MWVIKLEYYVGAHIAKPVAVFGLLIVLASLFMPDFMTSSLLGVLGGSIVWGAIEFPEQEKRVGKGIFPANPKKPTVRDAEIETKRDEK